MQHATVQRAARNVQRAQHATCSTQRATCSTQRATCNVQHATCNVQHATCNVQHATCNVQHATCNVQHAACNHSERVPMSGGQRARRNSAQTVWPCTEAGPAHLYQSYEPHGHSSRHSAARQRQRQGKSVRAAGGHGTPSTFQLKLPPLGGVRRPADLADRNRLWTRRVWVDSNAPGWAHWQLSLRVGGCARADGPQQMRTALIRTRASVLSGYRPLRPSRLLRAPTQLSIVRRWEVTRPSP
jgi:hypothetical protein